MSIFLNILIFLAVIDILVIAHEFGHLFAARAIGVPIISYSIGMGPVLARWKWRYFGDTEFRFSLFPIGGYVMVSGEAEESGDPNSLYTKSPWQRAWYAAAGALTNFALAFILFALVAMIWGEPIGTLNRIGMVQPGDVAATAGIKTGDWILVVNNKRTQTWDDVVKQIESRAGIKTSILVGQESGKIETMIDPHTFIGIDSHLFETNDLKVPENETGDEIFLEITKHPEDSYLSDFEKNPSKYKGSSIETSTEIIIEFDRIKSHGIFVRLNSLSSINGKPLNTWEEKVEALKSIKGETKLVFDQSLETRIVELTPRAEVVKGSEPPKEVGKIGVSPQFKYKHFGFFDALWSALEKFWLFLMAFVTLIGSLFKGKVPQVAGPVGIFNMVGQAAQIGFSMLLSFTALISLNLGFFNLVPFPGLDGGRIVFSLIEGITGKKLPRSVENIVHAVGFIILIGLVILVTLSDFGLFGR